MFSNNHINRYKGQTQNKITPEPNIHYDYAHIILDAEEIGFPQEDNLCNRSDSLQMRVGNNHFLEMHGVTIPLHGREKLSSKKDIFASARRIAGDLEENLEKYTALSEKGIVQDTLCFTPNSFHDYSRAEELERKTVTEWVRHAREYPSTLNNLPADVENKDDVIIKITSPTFQALRDIDTLGRGLETIKAPTFAEGINNFLAMYDTVTSHLNWIETEERRIRIQQRAKGEMYNPNRINVAELILSNS